MSEADTDRERSMLLQSTLDLLVSAGYFRARITTLSAFDKLTGGLAWCIAATNAVEDAQFNLVYDDEDLTLRDKIKVGEVIESSLQSMECPYPLQAHQIQGLDYQAVYPVVKWIVGRVLTMRAETGDELRRYAHVWFQNHFELHGESSKDQKVTENVTCFERILVDHPQFVSNRDRPLIHQSVEVPAITSMSNLVDTLSPLTLEDESPLLQKIKEEESNIHQLEEELSHAENSVKMLHDGLNEKDQKKADLLNEIQHLTEKIDTRGVKDMVERLMSLLELLKALERQETDFRSYCKQQRSHLQAEVLELEKEILGSNERKSHSNDSDHSLCDSLEKLSSAKREHAAKLRTILLLKRQLDDLPSQTELIQYERRFLELYVHIQEKLRQTRKYYATYNALLEIKKLMLKETSLLNSISSQFQDAMTSTTGRSKLMDSMEGIVNRTQQKLEKVQLGLQVEQKTCETLKEKYATAIAEQRRCSSLLKAFQEECAKNVRLQNPTSI